MLLDCDEFCWNLLTRSKTKSPRGRVSVSVFKTFQIWKQPIIHRNGSVRLVKRSFVFPSVSFHPFCIPLNDIKSNMHKTRRPLTSASVPTFLRFLWPFSRDLDGRPPQGGDFDKRLERRDVLKRNASPKRQFELLQETDDVHFSFLFLRGQSDIEDDDKDGLTVAVVILHFRTRKKFTFPGEDNQKPAGSKKDVVPYRTILCQPTTSLSSSLQMMMMSPSFIRHIIQFLACHLFILVGHACFLSSGHLVYGPGKESYTLNN